jgi:hypothetical protein
MNPANVRVDQPPQNHLVPVAAARGGITNSPKGRLRRVLESRKIVRWILCGVLVTAAVVYIGLLRPEGFGSYHDDGMYVVLAKALAAGQGYKLVSLPLEPDQTKSPPFYPFLLSLIWRMYPQFPQNVTWMMLLSVAATVSFLALAWSYLVRGAYAGPALALTVVTFAALNWRTIILATGVYSEMIYAVLSVVALFLAEKQEKEETSSFAGVALGTVMGLAFLTRSSGIALPVAVAAYYVVRRRWRTALIPVSVAALFVLAWLVWGHFHRPSSDSVNAGYYESYFSTLSQVIRGGEGQGLGSRLVSGMGFVAQNAFMLIFVTAPLVCLGLGYEWTQTVSGAPLAIGFVLFTMTFMFIMGGFFRFRKTGFRLLHAYVAAYVLIHILWPYAAYDRFLMPLLPWLLLFLVSELKLLAMSARKELAADTAIVKKMGAVLISVVLFLLGSLVVYDVQAGIRTLASSGSERSRFLEDQEAIQWISANAAPTDVVVCYRDPTYYLYTGRKTIRSISAREGGLTQEANLALNDQVRVIDRIIAESGPQFLVVTTTDFEQEGQAGLQRANLKALTEQNPRRFVSVFESTNGATRIFRIDDERDRSVR